MKRPISRRHFFKGCAFASAGTITGLSLEEKVLLAQSPAAKPPMAPGSKATLPTGKIGKLELSRLILGGNLISGWAHSRELMYVSPLVRHYFTPEKILETLELAEAHGINCVNLHPDELPMVQRYRKERGGRIKCIVQAFPDHRDQYESIQRSIDDGADAVYIQGAEGDKYVLGGKVEYLGKAVDFIKARGIPAGVAGHSLKVPMECEKAKLNVDFYVKTLHKSNYFSYRPPEDEKQYLGRHDNMWCPNPDEVIAFMQKVEKPWIAYKVMAAGAISPTVAFRHAFEGGADFILAGIFDFQVADDVKIASDALAELTRVRPWRG